jgi:hypothetical protein
VREALAYAVVCLAMWPVPLLNRLHVESAAVLAVAAFIIGGIAAIHRLPGESTGAVLLGRLRALAVPLALMLIPMLWAPNCAWTAGVGFFVLFPGISAVFGVSVAAVVVRRGYRRPVLGLLLVGTAIMLAGPVYDLGFHPQFYTYNHVFGGVLGPIYDEQLAIRPGLFVFRCLTLVWALLCFAWASGGRVGKWAPLGGLAVLGTTLLAGGALGINTGYDDLRRALPGALFTEHFEIRYDPASTDSLALRSLRDLHEFEYQRIAGLLDQEVGAQILTLVYPSPSVRAALTGARFTSVAPVWLRQPQVHVEATSAEAVFGHELVHVFSREFGMPLLNASPAVGLVEGLAVALEPPTPRPSVDDLVLVAGAATGLEASSALPDALSPWGFWTGRGGVSYTITGSFVRHLLREYPADLFKEAYRSGSVEAVYGRSVHDLVDDWLGHLSQDQWVDAGAVGRARSRLGATSLFERVCPHYRPEHLRELDRAALAWTEKDTVGALAAVHRALTLAPLDAATISAWTHLNMASGQDDTVRDTLFARSAQDLPVRTAIVRADLLAASVPGAAGAEYLAALRRLPLYARGERIDVALRMAGLDAGWTASPLTAPPGLPEWAARAWPGHAALRKASASYASGQVTRAAAEADASADAFRIIGDLRMEAYVRHMARRYRFASESSTTRL